MEVVGPREWWVLGHSALKKELGLGLRMNFVSTEFAVLLAAVLVMLAVSNHRGQNISLLVASYVFYAWWNWQYLGIIVGISLLDYYCAILIDKASTRRLRTLILCIGLAGNIGILAWFKYIDLLIESFNAFNAALGLDGHVAVLNILLPIGISFHTFQSMGYTIDVYRREVKPIRDPLDYQLFVTFFPQLVAGPIERATHLLPQIVSGRHVTAGDIEAGVKLMLLGYFKKVVIADNLAPMVDQVYSGSGTGLAVLLATYAFALQIYCDFSGYTDIARGVSRLMGFRLMENFRQPYFATNPSDFWRRWHISLSTWLRDYLYIPLGGNRYGAQRMYYALGLTMLIGGIWHGASWTFVLWGAFHGTLLIMHRLLFGRPREASAMGPVRRIASAILFFQITCVGWMIFRAQTWATLESALSRLLSPADWLDAYPVNVVLLTSCAAVVLAIDLYQEARPALLVPMLGVRLAFYACVALAVVLWAPQSVKSFIYFQF
jgi:alginate O-acetyltransferase complex protein AlgI